MTVVFDRPYQFVPPHQWQPLAFVHSTTALVDGYLRKKEGVVRYECRNLDRFPESLDRGDGILLAPNHCRYADPLVLGWPARESSGRTCSRWLRGICSTKVDSMLCDSENGWVQHQSRGDRSAVAGNGDRDSATAERPLILFPEGTTNRTNDVLKPLLDGVSFIARSAARRRQKQARQRRDAPRRRSSILCQDDLPIGPMPSCPKWNNDWVGASTQDKRSCRGRCGSLRAPGA